MMIMIGKSSILHLMHLHQKRNYLKHLKVNTKTSLSLLFKKHINHHGEEIEDIALLRRFLKKNKKVRIMICNC